jgi:hypothetical protein
MSSSDYYLVPGSLPSSAKMHILTNGNGNIGSVDGQLVTNGASSLTLSVNGKINNGGNIGGSVGVISAPYYSLNPTGTTTSTTMIIPNGTTAQRPLPSNSVGGYLRYNTDNSYSTLEYFRVTQGVYLQLYSPPYVSNVSPSTITVDAIGTQTLVITGKNFDINFPMSVIFYTKSFVASYSATTIQVTSTTSITVTIPLGVYQTSSLSNSPYSIRIISNFTGMSYTLFDSLILTSGAFVWIQPSPSLGTLYTSLPYSKAISVAGTYGSTSAPSNAPSRIIATYNGNPVTDFSFNPASAGYSLTSGTSLYIDASGYITGTVKNGYVAKTQTVSIDVIAYSPNQSLSYTQPLSITFSPLLLNFTTAGSTITPVNTYTYSYYAFSNANLPIVPAKSQISPSSLPPPASSATGSITLAPSITGTSVYSADPSYSFIDFLIVGGGGGGGSGYQGGGGGGGGLVSSGLNSNYTYNYNTGGSGGRIDGLGMGPYQMPQGLTTGVTISVSVGGGGPGGYYYNTGTFANPYNNRSGSGGNSSITFPVSNSSSIVYTAYGGGAGSGEQNISNIGNITGTNYQPLPGGCGGGSSHGMSMAYTNYNINSIQLTSSTYSGAPNYTLTVNGVQLSGSSGGSTTISPYLAVYNSTSTTPSLSNLIGFIAPYGTNSTTGAGGTGTYFLTGLTVSAGGSYANAPAYASPISSTTFTIPGGLTGTTTTSSSQNLIYTGIGSGTTYVGNYSLGFSNFSTYGGLTDAITGYQGFNGGFGCTNNPYVGGGGGGAGVGGGFANTAGNAGVGGNGLENFILTVNYGTTSPSAGTGTVYAGGGGGSSRTASGTAAGGTGGGGLGVNAWSSPSNLAGNGTNGLGGGGGSAGGSGGAGTNGQYGGSGGSGYVVIRYRSA